MPSIDDLLSNPGSSSIYLNHRFFYAIGNTPSVDLTEGCQVPTHAQFLLLGCGDIRNILQTVHEISQLQSKPKSLTFHLNDIDDVLLARNAVLLKIVNTIDPCKREDVEFLWNVWYDLHLSEDNLQRLKSVLTSILENPLESLTFESQECSTAVKTVLKQWLKMKMDIRETQSQRERFICQIIEARTKTSITFPDAVNQLYLNVKICRSLVMREHSEEMKTYFRTGSTDSESTGFTNPTFICPHINGWRVHPDGLPYFAFKKHAYMFQDELSLRENCILQLQLQLKSWNAYAKNGATKVSLWDGDALTLCYRRMPDSTNFNFINASNLCDHISLLNVLLACSKRLKRKGVLTMQTMHLLKKGYWDSLEKYLEAELAIPPSFCPTFLGLHLAEDFELGTSDTSAGTLSFGLHEVSTRWIAAEDCTSDIRFEASPEVESIFARLAIACFSLFEPKSQTDSLNVPLTLIYLMRQLSKQLDKGVKPLLDIAEKCLPTETSQSGQQFSPLKDEWNMLTRYFFRDQLASTLNEELVELHVPVQTIPVLVKNPAGLDIVNRAVLTQDSDSINFTKKTFHRSFRVITVLDFTYKTKMLTCVLTRSEVNRFGKDAYVQLFQFDGHPSMLITTGPVISIMSCGSSISIKDNNEATSRPQKRQKSRAADVKLTVRETDNDYRITIKSANIDKTIQMFEYSVNENTSNNIQLTYELRQDITDPQEMPVSAKIDVNVPCPAEPTEKTRCFITNTIAVSKSRHLVQGQIILPSRRTDISMYPRWSSSQDVFYGLLDEMYSTADDQRRKDSEQDAEDVGNTSFKVKETLQMLLNYSFCPPKEMPLVRAYILQRDERKEDQLFGFFPDDIFIGVRGLYNLRGTPTIDIVWSDFEIYRNQNPYLDGRFSKEAERFFAKNGGSMGSLGKTLHMIFISKQEAILLKKLLRFNSSRSIQRLDNCGSPKWAFNSFLQPLYSITRDFDRLQNLLGERRGQVMDFSAKIKEKTALPKDVAAKTPEKCGSCRLPKADMKKCSRCKNVVYCSKDCQRKDWEAGHKNVCVHSGYFLFYNILAIFKKRENIAQS